KLQLRYALGKFPTPDLRIDVVGVVVHHQQGDLGIGHSAHPGTPALRIPSAKCSRSSGRQNGLLSSNSPTTRPSAIASAPPRVLESVAMALAAQILASPRRSIWARSAAVKKGESIKTSGARSRADKASA